MIIKKYSDVPEEIVREQGARDVTKRVLIGPQDGRTDIVMRHFKVLPGGSTPLHSHNHEHVVKVEKGKGVVIDEQGKENTVYQGHSLLVEGGRIHQFKNPFDDPFEFLCVILNPERKPQQ